MKGTWQTDSDHTAVITVGAVVVAGALAWAALKSAAATLGDVAVITVTAVIALVIGAGVTLLAVRLRGRRTAAAKRREYHPAIAEAFDREHARAAGTAERRAIATAAAQAQAWAPVIAALGAMQRPPQPGPQPARVVRGEVEP